MTDKTKPFLFSKNDELYTPRIWVEYIVDFLEQQKKK